MPNPQIYTAELEKFKKNYNLPDYDLGKMMLIDQKFRFVNDFLTNDTAGNDPASQFTGLLKRTLFRYFEENTTLNADKKYMSSFHLKAFVDDFDRLADAQYRSTLNEGEVPQRKKYAGAKSRAIINALSNAVKDRNKTLPTLWKDSLKKGTMKADDLQAITANVMNIVRNPDADKTGLDNKIINVVAAHEALKQLRESRKGVIGWLWKRFHKDRNNLEKSSLEMFASQVNELRENNYDVDKIAADLAGKTVFGLKVESAASSADKEKKAESAQIDKEPIQNINLENSVNKEADKTLSKAEKKALDEQKKQEAAQKKKEDAELKKIRSRKSEGKIKNAEQAQEIMKDKDTTNEVTDQFKDILENSNSSMKRIVFMTLNTGIRTIVPRCWENFANATTPEQKNTAMRKFAFDVFTNSFKNIAYDIDDLSTSEKFIAAQKITDIALKTFTPADSESKYAEYSDNYFVKNATTAEFQQLAKSVGFAGNIDDVIRDTKAELIPQKLSIPALAENLGTENKSTKIDEPKHEVPHLKNTK